MTVEDNAVYDNWGLGIYIEETEYALVQRNLVYHTGDSTYFRHGNPCAGIQISDEIFGLRTSTHIKVINNFVKGHNYNFTFLWWDGISSDASMNNNLIANNTFVDATIAGVYISDPPTPHVNSCFENNIIYESSGALYSGDTVPVGITFSNNNWSSTPPAYVSNANDVIGNPQLTGGTVNTNYFKLQSNSPCIDEGKNNLSDVPYDFFGAARVNPPCIGGHEYGGILVTPTPMTGELLSNAGYESGITSWVANGGTIAQETSTVHSGTKSCKITNRTASWNFAAQDVKSALLSAGQGTYTLKGWIKLSSGTDTAGPAIKIVDSAGTHYSGTHAINVPNTNWTETSWTGSVTWTGELISATFYLAPNTLTVDIYVDDCSVIKQ
jgi:hypothetical protein